MSSLITIRYEIACNILGVLIAYHAKQAKHPINTTVVSDANGMEPSNQVVFKKLLSDLDPSDLVAIEKVIALYGLAARRILNPR